MSPAIADPIQFFRTEHQVVARRAVEGVRLDVHVGAIDDVDAELTVIGSQATGEVHELDRVVGGEGERIRDDIVCCPSESGR